MSYQFSFRHMDVSEALRDFAEQRLEKSFAHMTNVPHKVHMVFEKEVGSILVRADINCGNHDYHVSHSCENAYESVEKAMAKLDSQIRKNKPERKRGKGVKAERWNEVGNEEAAEVDETEEYGMA